MTDGPLRRLFWPVIDQFDYFLTQAGLRILDMLAGPLPETPLISRANASGYYE